MYARRRRRTFTIVLPGSFTKALVLEPLVARCVKAIVDCIPEEILGIAWELLAGSHWCGESSPCPRKTQLGQRPRPIVAAVEQLRTQVIAGGLLCIVYNGSLRRLSPYIRETP